MRKIVTVAKLSPLSTLFPEMSRLQPRSSDQALQKNGALSQHELSCVSGSYTSSSVVLRYSTVFLRPDTDSRVRWPSRCSLERKSSLPTM